jgi:sugar phosphate isomerase/epimerase
MHILLHTIALEPARWSSARVSRPLAELLPALEGAGFYKLEIFEPHLTLAPDEFALVDLFAQHHLSPMVLSSYLDLSPEANPEEKFAPQAQSVLARVERFGFKKVRLFPGRSPSPEQTAETVQAVAERLRHLADHRPEVEFLLETHDGSLADEPADVVEVIKQCARPNVGLLWQPTFFNKPDFTQAQFELQKPYIRHFHLQNRDAELGFVPLGEGLVPWEAILRDLNFGADITLEFVPSGICAPDKFDLTRSVQEAVEEVDWIARLERRV